MEIKATDPNGQENNKSVYMEIEQPDGAMFDYLFELNDLQYRKDRIAGDGIYTIDFQSSQTNKQQGVWKFYLWAVDKANAESNIIEHKMSNPGVTVTYPDSATTFTAGQTIQLKWESALIDTLSLEYTTNANEVSAEYIHITDLPRKYSEYEWTIPSDIESQYCKIRIFDKTKATRYDVSDEYFEVKK
jgi:hypothetical protein